MLFLVWVCAKKMGNGREAVVNKQPLPVIWLEGQCGTGWFSEGGRRSVENEKSTACK